MTDPARAGGPAAPGTGAAVRVVVRSVRCAARGEAGAAAGRKVGTGVAEPAREELDEAAVRRNARRLVLAVAVLCVVGLAAGFAAGALHDGGRGVHHPVRAALFIAGTAVVMVGLLVLVLAVFLRRPAYRRVMQFGWSERRRVWKAVKAGRPLSPREIQVAQAARDHLRRFRRTLWFAPVLVVIWLLDGLAQHGVIRWLMIGLAAVYAVLLPAGIWQWRRAADRYDDALSRT